MKNIIKVGVPLLASALFSISTAHAGSRPGFNFVDLSYVTQDLDSGCNQDGFRLKGSMAVNDQTFVQGSYSDVSGNGCGSEMLRLEGGIRADYGTSSRIYGLVSLINLDVGPDSDSGVGLQAGIRSIVNPGVAATAFIGYDKIDEFDQSYIGVGGVYTFTKNFSVVGNITITDNSDNGLDFGIRYHY